jgi:hypothetical protein
VLLGAIAVLVVAKYALQLGREVVSLYTDTWIRDGATWRVLGSHLSSKSKR